MPDRTITIMSKKVFRFPTPGVNILEQVDNPKQGDVKKAFFDTIPGDPQEAPDWILKDRMYELAEQDGDIFQVQVNRKKASQTDLDVKAAAAHAQGQLPKAEETEEEKAVNLDKMNKAQLLAHAADEHDLQLDEKLTKAEIVEHIEKAQEKKA